MTQPMAPGGAHRTPEELETLLEDAFVLRDHAALAALFEAAAVLVDGRRPAGRGGEAIARAALAMWDGDRRISPNHGRSCWRATSPWSWPAGINVMRRGTTAPGDTRSSSTRWRSSNEREETMIQDTSPSPGTAAADRRPGRGGGALVVRQPRRHQGDRRGHRRPDDDHRGHGAARHGGAAARPSPGGRGLLDPRRRRHLRGRRHDDRGARRRLRLRPARHPAPLHGRRPAAGCCSS